MKDRILDDLFHAEDDGNDYEPEDDQDENTMDLCNLFDSLDRRLWL